MFWLENLFPSLLHDVNVAIETAFAEAWTAWITMVVIFFFCVGTIRAITTHLRARRTILNHIDAEKPSLAHVEELAVSKGREIPFIVIAVPARDETAVIANTIHRLTRLKYPAHRYAAVIITDKREKRNGKHPTTHEIAAGLASRPAST